MSNEPKQGLRGMLLTLAGGALGAVLVLGIVQYSPWTHRSAPILEGDYHAALVPTGAPVAIVMREGCPACAAGKAWLAEHHITPRIVMVDNERDTARALLASVKTEAVPTLVSEHGAVVGFEPNAWSKLLAN